MMKPTRTTTALIQNGTRHPHDSRASSSSTAASGRKMAGARI
jgi:hypothetical protein